MALDSKDLNEEILEDIEEDLEKEGSMDIENDDLTKEMQTIKSELEDCKEKLLRTKAEYDNFRKRTEKEKLEIYSYAVSKTVLGILPIADSLELAEKSIEGGGEEYKKGLLMVKAQFNEALKKLGVEPFGEIGEEFNPDIHNAVSHIDDKKFDKENVISEVFQRGYMLKDKVIRHAMVQVAN